MTLVYLACPYSDPDPKIVEARVRVATKCAAWLMSKGYTVFSPITHSHYVADFLPEELRYSQEFWMKQDLPILAKCEKIFVLTLSGWEDSKGVYTETCKSEELGFGGVHLIDPGINWELANTNEPWKEVL